MLYLNKNDMMKAISMKDVIDAIDTAYEIYQSKQFQMPTRMQVTDEDNTLLLMPCFTKDAIDTKLITSFPNNTNHPVLHGLVILNSQENGEIMAIIDGSFMTAFRTGAIGGSAIRHLAKNDAATLAIIGTGAQGLYQAVAACTERSITDIYLYNRTLEKIPPFIASLQQMIDGRIKIHATDSAKEAITHAGIIITATTSREPVLPDIPELLTSKLIIGIGSFQPDMREFPRSLYQLVDTIFVDTEDAVAESGDIAIPLEKNWMNLESVQNMASFTNSKKQIQDGKTIVFKSTGMALFDIVVTNLVYQRALKKGIGQDLT